MSDPIDLRVSDEERDATAQEIREHYASGRLDDDELSARLSAAYAAKMQSELQAVRADLPPLPASPAVQKAELAARRSELGRRLIQQSGAGLTPFAICTVIWAVSGANSFFWPVFLLFAVIPPLVGNLWALYGPAPELERVERHLTRGHHADREDGDRQDRQDGQDRQGGHDRHDRHERRSQRRRGRHL